MFSFFLFIILAVLLLAVSIIRLVLRGLFPWFTSGRNRRQAGNGWEEGARRRGPSRKEGEVSIDYMPPRQDMRDARPGNSGSSGDYVDYVEIKDEEKS